uniref:C2H2-type domain-containing protein n=1 Tax=Steinernema glaseri TaxID=37863 RepID=A0A1I7Y6R1_9BILA
MVLLCHRTPEGVSQKPRRGEGFGVQAVEHGVDEEERNVVHVFTTGEKIDWGASFVSLLSSLTMCGPFPFVCTILARAPVEPAPKESMASPPEPSEHSMAFEALVYNYLREKKPKLLTDMFDEESRQEFEKNNYLCEDNPLLSSPWSDALLKKYARFRYDRMKERNEGRLEVWECLKCKTRFTTHESHLTRHIGAHEDLPCPCVVEDCEESCKCPSSLISHLKDKHGLRTDTLSRPELARLKQVESEFAKNAEVFREKYFPIGAFIGFNTIKRLDTQEMEDPVCRECCEIINSATTRRRHVAGHLKLSYPCVFEGCECKGVPCTLAAHFTKKHFTKVSDLDEDQLVEYKRIKLDFANVVKKEVSKYFPHRDQIREEEPSI